ncbi:MAG: SMP-30/gluconolactonase/LRE family protein [Nitrospirota bacterium]|nr:MAG: SMP-30/gluconolactonase/LRE family protein [Nitrospirota bacterium]
MHGKVLLSLVLSLAWFSVLDSETPWAANSQHPVSSSICQSPEFPRWTYDHSNLFPKDQPLARPEDGRALPDGRLIVADQRHGLLLIEKDESHRPFGNLKKAGYVHNPPDFPGAPNGVFLEHDARHVLMVDIFTGKIFRVNTHTEETRLIYDHPYGVNSIYRDHAGTIWFTQSTNNPEERGEEDLWAAANLSIPTGAIFKLPGSGDAFAAKADEVVSNLYLANGIMADNSEQFLYVSESMMDRVLRFRLDVQSGTLSDGETYQLVPIPDNLAIDADNNLWIVSFFANQISVVDHQCRSVHTIFRPKSKKRDAALDEWIKRSHLGQPRLDVLKGNKGNPLPISLTGLFFSPNHDAVYFTGLGNAILKFTMPTD